PSSRPARSGSSPRTLQPLASLSPSLCYCPAALRPLPSFPTRRSSDLSPNISTCPKVGLINPNNIRIVVVFPAPFRPKKPKSPLDSQLCSGDPLISVLHKFSLNF